MNKKLFSSSPSIKEADTLNHAGGKAYLLSDEAALAQFAGTGCFNGTYYVSDEDQLKKVIELANKCSPLFIAQVALYAREQSYMKDLPSFLAAILVSKDTDLLEKIFPRVIDSPKMLRNFMQAIRSGATGKKSFGSKTKKMIQKYFSSLTDEQLFKADIGNSPSLPDMIKMIHPKPENAKRSAMYSYLLGKEYNQEDLIPLARAFEDFKKDMVGEIPDVPFQLLTALPLEKKHWKQMAEDMTWTQLRINLNTLLRHDVLSDTSMVNMVAKKLSDPDLIKKAKVFPYQLFAAFKNVSPEMPEKIKIALQKAAEIAIENIPSFDGQVYIFPDVSGSMGSPITGSRGSASSKMRCIDVAGLISAAILRKNPDAKVIPFDTRLHVPALNGMDSIMTNAEKLASYGGGGTCCELPLQKLNKDNAKGDLLIYVSDSESWASANGKQYYGTGLATEWAIFKKRNPRAKLACLDLTPNTSAQIEQQEDVLLVGSFSDNVFNVISSFAKMGNNANLWVKTIKEINI